MTNAASSIGALASSPNLNATIASLKDASANLNLTLIEFRKDLNRFNGKVDPVLASLKQTSDRAQLTLTQMAATMNQLQMTFAPDAPLTYRMNVTLDDIAAASNAMRELADYLQRNPSALVRGKYVSESKR